MIRVVDPALEDTGCAIDRLNKRRTNGIVARRALRRIKFKEHSPVNIAAIVRWKIGGKRRRPWLERGAHPLVPKLVVVRGIRAIYEPGVFEFHNTSDAGLYWLAPDCNALCCAAKLWPHPIGECVIHGEGMVVNDIRLIRFSLDPFVILFAW